MAPDSRGDKSDPSKNHWCSWSSWGPAQVSFTESVSLSPSCWDYPPAVGKVSWLPTSPKNLPWPMGAAAPSRLLNPLMTNDLLTRGYKRPTPSSESEINYGYNSCSTAPCRSGWERISIGLLIVLLQDSTLTKSSLQLPRNTPQESSWWIKARKPA